MIKSLMLEKVLRKKDRKRKSRCGRRCNWNRSPEAGEWKGPLPFPKVTDTLE